MSMPKRTLILLAGLLGASLTLSVSAAPGGMGDCPGGMHGGHFGVHDPAKMQQFVARHLAALHDKLKLSAAQEAAWTTYSDAVKAQVAQRAQDTPPTPESMQKLSTPERMDQMLARMKTHEQALTQHLADVKQFYAQLTPDQQKVFDAHSLPHHGMGHHGGHHGHAPAPDMPPA